MKGDETMEVLAEESHFKAWRKWGKKGEVEKTGEFWGETSISKYSSLTPLKTNMEPENGPLEKEIPIGNHHFQVPC